VRQLFDRQTAVQKSRCDQLSETAAKNFRHAELRIVGGINEVVTIHDAQRAAEAIAVHLRNDDARECAYRFGDLDGEARAVPVEQRAVRDFTQEVEVKARGVDSAGALGDDHLELLVSANDLQRFEEGKTESAIPAIALIRPVQDDARHARILDPFQNELRPLLERSPGLGHGSASALIADAYGTGRTTSTRIMTLERDDFSLHRHPALAFCLSMVFSEPLRTFRDHASARLLHAVACVLLGD